MRNESGLLDWRKDYSALSYRVVDLPDRLSRTLHEYLGHFGLVSGSFDLALDKNGAPHWLELNPNGQWGLAGDGDRHRVGVCGRRPVRTGSPRGRVPA